MGNFFQQVVKTALILSRVEVRGIFFYFWKKFILFSFILFGAWSYFFFQNPAKLFSGAFPKLRFCFHWKISPAKWLSWKENSFILVVLGFLSAERWELWPQLMSRKSKLLFSCPEKNCEACFFLILKEVQYFPFNHFGFWSKFLLSVGNIFSGRIDKAASMCPHEHVCWKKLSQKCYLHLLTVLSFWNGKSGIFAKFFPQVVETATRMSTGTISVVTILIIVFNFWILSDSNWKKSFGSVKKTAFDVSRGSIRVKLYFMVFSVLFFFDSERKDSYSETEKNSADCQKLFVVFYGRLATFTFQNLKNVCFFSLTFFRNWCKFFGALALRFRQC